MGRDLAWFSDAHEPRSKSTVIKIELWAFYDALLKIFSVRRELKHKEALLED